MVPKFAEAGRSKAETAARQDDLAGARRFNFLVSKTSIDVDETERKPAPTVGWRMSETVAIELHRHLLKVEEPKHARHSMSLCNVRPPAVRHVYVLELSFCNGASVTNEINVDVRPDAEVDL